MVKRALCGISWSKTYRMFAGTPRAVCAKSGRGGVDPLKERAPGVGHTAPEEIDSGSILVASADLVTVVGNDGTYTYVSPACHRLFGWDPSELKGHAEDHFVHPDDLATLRSSRADHESVEPTIVRYRFLGRDRSYCWVEATSSRIILGESTAVVSTIRNASERGEEARRLEYLAATDPLTGVANRTVLMDRLRQGLLRLDRTAGLLAVLYVDLDRFKIINDSLGHRIGDAVLLNMAERLTHHLRPADTLARLGGDEFVIVAEGMTDEAAVVDLAKRVIEAGREAFQVGEEEFICTLSVGIASTADGQRDAGDLLHEADLALYRAKDRGRDRAEVFDEDLRTKAMGRLVTERLLRRAVDDGRIVVEYQPIIDLPSGHLVGAEALVRIQDTGNGLLQPASFLEVAEETGLLITIDERVLVDAAMQAAGWRARLGESGRGEVEVAINVTARHLADTGFHDEVINLLDRYNLPHHALQIEVTERVLIEASNSAMTGLRALRGTGIRVGLDDFGTGYSSLSYLRQFPLDFVKIDKSFIDELEHDKADRAIVAAIIGLVHALDLTVVAEGVETQGQRRILEELGCERAQGFLFAPSGRPGAIDELVLAGSSLSVTR
jgi:diguanylate cyclase (GGDEF)-like protein/PAS domain S-box-containing protein